MKNSDFSANLPAVVDFHREAWYNFGITGGEPMALYLTKPARRHRKAWEALCRDFEQAGETAHFSIGAYKSFGHFLRKCKRAHKGRNPHKGFVPASVFFLMEEGNDKILGMLSIRHRLTENLLNLGGHIGYAITPSERRKGYAAEQLRLGLEICRSMGMGRVLLTCKKDNIASAKVIVKNGGVLEDERFDEKSQKIFQRYWIELT